MKGTWREGFLARDPERYGEKALETGISFHRGPFWGTWMGTSFLGPSLKDFLSGPLKTRKCPVDEYLSP